VTRRILAAACAAAVIAVIAPAVAGAATRNAFAGGDEVIRNAPPAFSPNAFLRRTMTIRVGDTVRWRFRGFHTVTFPVKGKQPPSFAVPGQGTVSGQLDGADPVVGRDGIDVLAPLVAVGAPVVCDGVPLVVRPLVVVLDGAVDDGCADVVAVVVRVGVGAAVVPGAVCSTCRPVPAVPAVPAVPVLPAVAADPGLT